MSKVTFREFAGSVMQNQLEVAADQLEYLLGLPREQTTKAVAFFQQAMKEPGFMPKAMGLRTAVETGTDDEIGDILVLCFGLDPAQRATAVATTRVNYPRPS